MQREKLMRKKSGTSDRLRFQLSAGRCNPPARHGAQVAGYATLFAIGVAGQYDAAAIARRQVHRFFRVLQGVAFAKAVTEHHHQASQLGTGTLNDVANIFEHGSNPH